MYRYQEVYQALKQGILTNQYQAGTALPTQESLTERFEVSRLTLKKSLDLLKTEGLIFSRRGSGTYVRPQLEQTADELLPLDSPVGMTYSHKAQEITSQVLAFSARLPDQEEQRKLDLAASTPVYEIERIRYLNGREYSYEYIIMPTTIAPLNEKILLGSIYDYLGQKYKLRLTDARRVVYAENADEKTANNLKTAPQTAVLVIEQIAYSQNGKPFEYSVSRFLGQKSKFGIDIHL